MTGLLLKWGRGDEAALERLIPLVHREIHEIARRCMFLVESPAQTAAVIAQAVASLGD